MIILIIIAMAVLAIEISYESSLAQDVKEWLRMDEIPSTVQAISKLAFWNKLFSKYLFPINILLVLLFTIYKKFIELLNCAYCLSFWLSSISMYLYSSDIITSVLYGLITIPVVHLLEKLYE